MKLFSPTELVRKVAVITLAFWLAGAGCLLGCEGMAAAAPADHHDSSSSSTQASTLVVEGDACASTEGHSCCKKKARATRKQTSDQSSPVHRAADVDSSSTKLNESSTSGMRACPFAISRAMSVAKARDDESSAVEVPRYALPVQPGREQKLALSTTSPLPNRGHTYLRCCTFLI
ncbi:MAG TPA: hypothetical protein VJV03_01185 [Pyrinomonadaceae bacterium]|nr:hypothetical protein [Pyrinomonadaceae bacterium]